MIVCAQILATAVLFGVTKVEQIEAIRNDIMPVESVIEYMKKREDQIHRYSPIYNENEENPETLPIEHHDKKKTVKHKKQKNAKLKKMKKMQHMKKTFKSFKKNPKSGKSKWTQVIDNDSRLSESTETSSIRGNPVDIIVHIKMNK